MEHLLRRPAFGKGLATLFNVSRGYTSQDDFNVGKGILEPIPSGPKKDWELGPHFDAMRKDFYDYLSWDPQTGEPSPAVLQKWDCRATPSAGLSERNLPASGGARDPPAARNGSADAEAAQNSVRGTSARTPPVGGGVLRHHTGDGGVISHADRRTSNDKLRRLPRSLRVYPHGAPGRHPPPHVSHG